MDVARRGVCAMSCMFWQARTRLLIKAGSQHIWCLLYSVRHALHERQYRIYYTEIRAAYPPLVIALLLWFFSNRENDEADFVRYWGNIIAFEWNVIGQFSETVTWAEKIRITINRKKYSIDFKKTNKFFQNSIKLFSVWPSREQKRFASP